jgi:hypothetical protein
MIRIEGSGSGPWRLVQKDSMQTNTVRHVFAFERVCSYHGVYNFVFVLWKHCQASKQRTIDLKLPVLGHYTKHFYIILYHFFTK